MDRERNKSEVDGVASEKLEETVTSRQPKKRFVGRRQIAENTARGSGDSPAIDGSSVQGVILCLLGSERHLLTLPRSCAKPQDTAHIESNTFRNTQ
jgi:hypothetical protein